MLMLLRGALALSSRHTWGRGHVQVVSTSSCRLSGGGGLLAVVLAAAEVGGRRYGVAAVAACDAAASGTGK